jgi:acyl dehydratase
MAIKQGWTGRVFEDFEVGDVYEHPLGRTLLAADNIWFTLSDDEHQPDPFRRGVRAQTEFGKPLVNSC